jgi:hypothetical protein
MKEERGRNGCAATAGLSIKKVGGRRAGRKGFAHVPRRAGYFLFSLVDISPVTDVVQVNATLDQVEFVKHAVITHSQLEFGAASEALMREIFEPRTHLVDLALDGFACGCRQGIESFGECWRPDLERGGHSLFRLSTRILPGGNLAAGLLKLGFDLIGQFKLLLEVIVDPLADLFDFSAR